MQATIQEINDKIESLERAFLLIAQQVETLTEEVDRLEREAFESPLDDLDFGEEDY